MSRDAGCRSREDPLDEASSFLLLPVTLQCQTPLFLICRNWQGSAASRLMAIECACALVMENLDALCSRPHARYRPDLHTNPIQLKLALTSYFVDFGSFFSGIWLVRGSIGCSPDFSARHYYFRNWISASAGCKFHSDFS